MTDKPQFGPGYDARVRDAVMEPLDIGRVRLLGGDKEKPYLEGIGIVRTLDRVFGPDGWAWTTTEARLCMEPVLQEVPGKPGKKRWMAVAQATGVLRTRQGGWRGGTGVCESWQGEALGPNISMALKGAETDALKRAAALLGTPFGLSLRDRDDRLGEGSYEDMLRDMEAARRADVRDEGRDRTAEPTPRQAAPQRTEAPREPTAPQAPPQGGNGAAEADAFSGRGRKDLMAAADGLAGRWVAGAGEDAALPQALQRAGILGPDDLFGAPEAKLPTDRLRQIVRDLDAEVRGAGY